MPTDLAIRHGPNFSVLDAGTWADLRQHIYEHPKLGSIPGKLFLRQPLGLTALEISLGVLAPGVATPFGHRHRVNEEVYIFLKGHGQFLIDDSVLEIREGTVIRVGPPGVRAWKNTSAEPLQYLVIQARAGTLDTGTLEDAVHVPLAAGLI